MNNIILNQNIAIPLATKPTVEEAKRLQEIQKVLDKANFTKDTLKELKKAQSKVTKSASRTQILTWMLEYYGEAEELRNENEKLKAELEKALQSIVDLENLKTTLEATIKEKEAAIEKLTLSVKG